VEWNGTVSHLEAIPLFNYGMEWNQPAPQKEMFPLYVEPAGSIESVEVGDSLANHPSLTTMKEKIRLHPLLSPLSYSPNASRGGKGQPGRRPAVVAHLASGAAGPGGVTMTNIGGGAVGPTWPAEAAARLITMAATEIKPMILVQSVSEYVLLDFASIHSEFCKTRRTFAVVSASVDFDLEKKNMFRLFGYMV
jgi:hypothetical protein